MAVSRRHVMLVGLPGSGKSTIGRLVADRLDAPFADFDLLIEQRAAKDVQRIFAEDGEGAFRALEATIGAEQLTGPPSVLAPGGGYVLDPVQRRLALAMSYVVYLVTSPAVAARRLEGQTGRPLLKGFDPTLRLQQLLELRRDAYMESPGQVTTDALAPDAVADQVVQLARTGGGW